MALRINDKTEMVLDAFQTHGYATTGYLHEEAGLTRATLYERLGRLHTELHRVRPRAHRVLGARGGPS